MRCAGHLQTNSKDGGGFGKQTCEQGAFLHGEGGPEWDSRGCIPYISFKHTVTIRATICLILFDNMPVLM